MAFEVTCKSELRDALIVVCGRIDPSEFNHVSIGDINEAIEQLNAVKDYLNIMNNYLNV